MRLSPPRIVQWVAVIAGIALFAGLEFRESSEAKKTTNAPVADRTTQSLLGYWKMDEGTGTSTTADSSGNANNLTMTAMEEGDWVAGTIGAYSLDFDGSAEWLTVADPASGVLDIVDGADFSIVGWFNRDTENTLDTIVAKRNSDGASDAGYLVWIGTDDFVNVEISDGTDQYIRTSTSAYATTGWHHFAAVWDDIAGMSLYLDGANQGASTGTIGNINSLANAVPFRIAAESSTGTENPFDGKIDDVKLYGKALSANEVQKLYQTTVPVQAASTAGLDNGLVGYWTFDGPDVIWGDTSNEIKDLSGKGNHGDTSGLTTTSVVPGKLGQGMGFNESGSSGQYITVAGPVLSNTFTVSLWVRGGDDHASFNQLVGECDSNPSIYYYGSGGEHGKIHLYPSGGYSTVALSDYVWHHVAVVNNSGSATFYLDGQTNGTDSGVAGFTVQCIGSNTTYSEDFSGKIDDIRIYNRVLSATEITNLYNLGK